jgi:chromosome segregation ATPase
VAAGSLPVRSRPLGLNKRTRHVRASDLAQLSPIVDASATISGATAQIDLLSIPIQQANILLQQHQIEANLGALSTQVVEATSSQQTQILEQVTHLSQLEQAIGQLQTDFGTQVQQTRQQHKSMRNHATGLQKQVRQSADYTRQLQDELRSLGVELASYAERQEVQQVEQQQVQLQHIERIERLEQLAARIHKIEQRQAKEIKDYRAQKQRIDDVATRLDALNQRVGQAEEMLTDVISQEHLAQQAAEIQIQELRTSVTRLRKETRQQILGAVKQASDLQQKVQVVQAAVNANSSDLQEVAGEVAGQHDLIEQLSQQVLTLSTTIHDLRQQPNEGKQPVRNQHSGRPRRLKTE